MTPEQKSWLVRACAAIRTAQADVQNGKSPSNIDTMRELMAPPHDTNDTIMEVQNMLASLVVADYPRILGSAHIRLSVRRRMDEIRRLIADAILDDTTIT